MKDNKELFSATQLFMGGDVTDTCHKSSWIWTSLLTWRSSGISWAWCVQMAALYSSTQNDLQCHENWPLAKGPEFVSWVLHTTCVTVVKSVLSLSLHFPIYKIWEGSMSIKHSSTSLTHEIALSTWEMNTPPARCTLSCSEVGRSPSWIFLGFRKGYMDARCL